MSNNCFQNCIYLLGCYLIIADGEINTKEIGALESFLHIDSSNKLYAERQKIFSDEEDKISVDTLLSELKKQKLTEAKKKEAIEFLTEIAFSDSYMSAQERELITKVAKALNIGYTEIIDAKSQQNDEDVKSSRLKTYQKVIGKVQKTIYDNFANKESTKAMDRLFDSLNFSTVIEKITDDAITDLERVTTILQKINSNLKVGKQDLDLLDQPQTSRKEVQQILDTVNNIKAHFDSMINYSLSDNLEMLDKKRRNIRYFTIAFMGRTKAGKSTFHKVITQEKNDDIGVGKLRTTRYNRSWYWDKLRIVDTPGIGAPGGDVDTEIAKSIIDEADLICYIVTSDAIQETEFDFFETIKERNKPLYIILNVKNNLTEGIRLKRFLKEPNKWRECDGPQSIQGHFDRIMERLQGKYNMDAVKIIPIHLLAAQLAMDKQNSSPKESETLLEGSNIMEFTRSVKKEIYESGSLKKSLSIIDGSAYQTDLIHRQISSDTKRLKTDIEKFKKKRSELDIFVRMESSRLLENIKCSFDNALGDLQDYASTFAEQNYDNKNAGKAWGNDKEVKSIIESLNKKIGIRLKAFNEKLTEKLEEIVLDIQISTKFSSTMSLEIGDITNYKLGVGISMAILTAAAPLIISQLWHPGGWVLMAGTIVVGLVGDLITKLFTSKTEKQRKAKEKLREQLHNNIQKSIKENKEAILSKVQTSISETTKAIEVLLGTYIREVEQLLVVMEDIDKKCMSDEGILNSLIGCRILDFLKKGILNNEQIAKLTDEDLTKHYPVLRDWKNQAFVFDYSTKCNSLDRENAEKATQMRITFK